MALLEGGQIGCPDAQGVGDAVDVAAVILARLAQQRADGMARPRRLLRRGNGNRGGGAFGRFLSSREQRHMPLGRIARASSR
jgi:hypothetical protein